MVNLTKDQVIELNRQIVNHTNEPFLIINNNGLESAIGNQFQPYELVEQIISIVFKSIILNHPFQNGNKRTAVACLKLFNVSLKCSDEQIVNLTYKIAGENGSQISVNSIANILFDLKLDESLDENELDEDLDIDWKEVKTVSDKDAEFAKEIYELIDDLIDLDDEDFI